MGIQERKEREKEEKKKLILKAARKLFLDNGFQKTSIRDIAKEIEYSPGTIYLYFKDKNELLLKLHDESFEGLINAFSKIEKNEDPMKMLISMGEEYLNYGFENPELYDLMFLMSAPLESLDCKDEIWVDGLKSFNMLHGLVEICQKAGYFNGHNLDDLSFMIWAQVHGFVSIYVKNRATMFGPNEQIPKIKKAYQLFAKNLATL